MQTILVLSLLALCVFAHADAAGSTGAPLSAEKKAEIKAKVQEKLSTLSPAAQAAGAKIIAAFEANEGNMEATKAAVESILSGVADSVKTEIASILPGGRHFLGHHRQTTPSA